MNPAKLVKDKAALSLAELELEAITRSCQCRFPSYDLSKSRRDNNGEGEPTPLFGHGGTESDVCEFSATLVAFDSVVLPAPLKQDANREHFVLSVIRSLLLSCLPPGELALLRLGFLDRLALSVVDNDRYLIHINVVLCGCFCAPGYGSSGQL